MRLIPFVNLLVVILLLCAGAGIIISIKQAPPLPEQQILLEEGAAVPKSSFQVEDPLTLSRGPLCLRFGAPSMSLPNLQNELVFHGTSERPDLTSSTFYLSLASGDTLFSHSEGTPLYLSYRRDLNGPAKKEGYYVVSEMPTNLWLDLALAQGGKKLDVSVHILDENGVEVRDESANRQFSLQQVAFSKEKSGSFELGDLRVDSTLLIRQKARWIGSDRFLQMHGGEEFSYALGRERIDFMAAEQIYSCFVGKGDMLIWKEGRWCTPLPGEATWQYPLLVVKKIDEKVISFDLWDETGKIKTPLNLIRSRDMGGMPQLDAEFRFVGAKTWAQFIVETSKERFTIKPYDWLVLTSEGWIKLDNAGKIDDYVNQKMIGPLLVLDKMGKQNGKQVITGHLFNSSRTEVLPVELDIASSAYGANSTPFYFKPQTINGDEQ